MLLHLVWVDAFAFSVGRCNFSYIRAVINKINMATQQKDANVN